MIFILLSMSLAMANGHLSSSPYTLNLLRSQQDPHCTPCNQLQGDLSSYFDHNGDGVCCVKTPEDILRLIDVQIARQGVIPATEQRPHVSFHAVLSLDHRRSSPFRSEISPSEWTLRRDTAFCRSRPNDFCLTFNSQGGSGFTLPFTGQYTINCRLAWRANNTDVRRQSLQISRSARGSSSYEFLVSDDVTPRACTDYMCAHARVQTTVKLNQGDQLFVTISSRHLLIEQDELSFLEMSARPSLGTYAD
ncbi:hypothetical protein CAPTEDRAFT_199913 [Capitella teleta]|uniref:TNF family profile domain-containing protein n=1 Tax=Capitella teleta TaxID=283909 RepID=R7UD48_CAPTE|nr:hypothetical protein CAPTEDRAFT_199913 [Capitella teleta]|eukprot:ELU04011.1 hypothetical protein CAPTEDRAFT_199913 [Capitella teleta]